MKNMKSLIAAAAFAATAALVLAAPSASAQCQNGRKTVADELHSSGETLVGTVVEARNTFDSSVTLDGVNYTVKIDRVLHGKLVHTDTVTIYSENSADKFPMQVGKQYLLFVHQNDGRYEVDNCGNSGLLEASSIENFKQLKAYAKANY